MPRKKVSAEPENSTAAEIVKQLNDVTSIWRPTHVISGHALEFVKEKVAELNEILSPAEAEEGEVEETK